jgi:hypothetical protein
VVHIYSAAWCVYLSAGVNIPSLSYPVKRNTLFLRLYAYHVISCKIKRRGGVKLDLRLILNSTKGS